VAIGRPRTLQADARLHTAAEVEARERRRRLGRARPYHAAVSNAPDVDPPREPEIEALGRLATGALRVLRGVARLAGVVGIGWGLYSTVTHGATGIVWLCAGIPLVLHVEWLFGRGRWLVLGGLAVLWFATALLPDDHEYGWVLRMFASLVAYSTLFVWRTLWSLTQSAAKA
jgi:hypothetical protein